MLQVTAYESTDNFYIQKQGNTEFRGVLTNLRLYVKQIKLADGLSLNIQQKLASKPAFYPILKSNLRTFQISSGISEYNANIFLPNVPRNIYCVLVPTHNFTGNSNSPFKFDHGHVRSICIEANGKQFPNIGYKLNFTNNDYSRLYYDFLEHMGP